MSGMGEGLVITQRRQLPPVIAIDPGAVTGGYAGSTYAADQPGGVWQVDGADLPGATAQSWVMTLALEGHVVTYRVGDLVSNAIQMWTPKTLSDVAGAMDVRQGLYLDSLRLYGWTPIAGAMYYAQPVAAKRPLMQPTGAAGRPEIYLDFDRSLDVSNLRPAPAARTFVGRMHFRAGVDPVNWLLLFENSAIDAWCLGKSWAAPADYFGFRSIGILTRGIVNIHHSTAATVDGNTYLIAAKTARPSGNYGFRIDGAAAGGGNIAVPAFADHGGAYTITGFGGLCSHLIADAYLSDADIARAEGWIEWTSGNPSNLPSGHPCEFSGPRIL